jgi:Tol biopolymer transport system component
MKNHILFLLICTISLGACRPSPNTPDPAILGAAVQATLRAHTQSTQLAQGVDLDRVNTAVAATLTPRPAETANLAVTANPPAVAPVNGQVPLVLPNPNWYGYGKPTLLALDEFRLQILSDSPFASAPQVSPNGKQVAYLQIPAAWQADAYGNVENFQDVWLVNADGSHGRLISQGDAVRSGLVWVGNARLAWVEGGKLVLFDVASQTIQNTPHSARVLQASVAGTRLGMIDEQGALLWLDPQQPDVLQTVVAAGDLSPAHTVHSFAWLSDGLFYTLADASEQVYDSPLGVTYQLFRANLDGSEAQEWLAGVRNPVVSLDEKQVAVLSGSGYGDACGADVQSMVVEITADGQAGAVQAVSDFSLPPALQQGTMIFPSNSPHWLPDGRFVANFAAICAPTDAAEGAYWVDTRQQMLTQLTYRETVLNPNESPAQQLAKRYPNAAKQDFVVLAPRSPGSLLGNLAVVRIADGSVFSLTDYGYNRDVVVSPDGQQIAYRSIPTSVVEAAGTNPVPDNGEYNIWVIQRDGSSAKILTESLAVRGVPAWSPDGTHLAFVENGVLVEVNVLAGTRRETGLQAGLVGYHPTDGITFTNPQGGLQLLTPNGEVTTLIDAALLPANTDVWHFSWLNPYSFVYTLADTSNRIGNSTIGIVFSSWTLYYPNPDLNIAMPTDWVMRENRVKPVGVGESPSYAIAISGSGYADSCDVDSEAQLWFPDAALGLAPSNITPLKAFNFVPAWVGEKIYLQEWVEPSVQWLADHQLVLHVGVTCPPPESESGIGWYWLDPATKTAVLVVLDSQLVGK